MTKRADCFDNAALESWNHHFKIDAIHVGKLEQELLLKIMCSNTSRYITIENAFIRQLATKRLNRLKCLAKCAIFRGKIILLTIENMLYSFIKFLMSLI